MQTHLSFGINSKPFVASYFELPKAIGRAAIREDDSRDHMHMQDQFQSSSKFTSQNRETGSDRFSSTSSMSVK